MKKTLLLPFSSFLLPFLLALSAPAAQTVSVPVLSEEPGLIDGQLTDPCWSKALTLTPFTPIVPNAKPPVLKTEAKVFATKDKLYVGMIGYVKDQAFAQRQSTDAKANVFAIDHFEVFVDPGCSGNLLQMAFGVNGDLWVIGKKSESVRRGVQVYADRYEIEAEIPFDIFTLAREGFQREWLFNVSRDARLKDGADPEFTSWSKLSSGTFHETSSFNRLTGIDYDLAASFARQAAAVKKPLELGAARKLWTGDAAQFCVETNGKVKFDKIACLVSNLAGQVVWKGTVAATGAKTVVDVPLKGAADGRYRFEAELVKPTAAAGAAAVQCQAGVVSPTAAAGAAAVQCQAGLDFWKIPPKRTKPKTVYTCKDLNIYKNGEFFFPLITWGGAPGWGCLRDHRFDTNAFFKCYHAILDEQRELGFNTILTGPGYYPDLARKAVKNPAFRKYFAAWDNVGQIAQLPFGFPDAIKMHAEHDLAIIPYLHFEPDDPDRTDTWLAAVLEWRESDNILCWHLSDELDHAIDHNWRLNEFHHQADPDRLTWVNCIQGIAANRDNADILSTDPYPIPYGPVTMVGFHVKRLMDTCRPNQSPWLWVQMFGGEGSWTRSPTFAELQAMVYITLNRGVRGIAYFIYSPSLVNRNGIRCMTLEDHKKLGPMNRRVERLAKMYCLGEVIERTADDEKLTDIAVLKYDGAFFVSVVNGKPAKQRISVKLPAALPRSGTAEVDGENRSLAFKDGLLEEDFEPFAVHIYRMK